MDNKKIHIRSNGIYIKKKTTILFDKFVKISIILIKNSLLRLDNIF